MMPDIETAPDDLLEIAADYWPKTSDRGWIKLVGSKSNVCRCTCDKVYLIPLRLIKTLLENVFKVGQCPTCENFLYIEVSNANDQVS